MLSDNLKASLLMVAAMGGFAIEDAFIKTLGQSLPAGEILLLLGIGGTLIFGVIARFQGVRLFHRDMLHRTMMLRNIGEVIGTAGFFMSLILAPLTIVSSIIQVMPLVVTLGAALVLGEQVGWRRWSAIFVGFMGVLLIIRPGGESFEATSLLALVGVLGLSMRDLATRAAPPTISSVLMITWAFALLAPLGLLYLLISGGAVMPSATDSFMLIGMLTTGSIAYYMITLSTRLGAMSVIAPFRYTRLIFALIIGVTIFSERPDSFMLIGAAMVCLAGLYGFFRENRLKA